MSDIIIGPRFGHELAEAGLLGLDFSWDPSGVHRMGNLTPEQQTALQAVIDAHDPTAPKPEPIPDIDRAQLRLWLLNNKGKSLDDVKALIEQMPEPDRSVALIELEDRQRFRRSHPLFDAIGPHFGMTAEETDQAFREASLL